MAKARKLKSGNWNVQVYDYTDAEGKRHCQSFTAETKAEAELMAAQFNKAKKLAGKKRRKADMTVGDAIDRYIELSECALSPTTVARYRKIRLYAFPGLMKEKIARLSDEDMQEAINAETQRISEKTGKQVSIKTVVNEWGLVASAAKRICGISYDIRLPKRQRGIKTELPDPALLARILKGTDSELPCLLAMWLSFSMSEVRGLKCSDLQGDILTINRVKVDVDGYPEIKNNAKVDTRKRSHRLPPYLLNMIISSEPYQEYLRTGEDDFLFQDSEDAIRKRLQRLCEANGIKGMTFHKLRHINASVMLMLNIPDKYAMERGGWKTPHVMHEVYQHTFSAERQNVDAVINSFFEDIICTPGKPSKDNSVQSLRSEFLQKRPKNSAQMLKTAKKK